MLTLKCNVKLVNLGILIIVLIVSIPLSSLGWNVASPHDRNRQCAQIYFQASFKGPSFVLKDDEQISDLTEIQSYYKKNSERVKLSLISDDNHHENDSSSIVYSFHIEEGCKLEVSPLAYLKGNVQEFLGDVEEVPTEWFMPKSVACECPKTCQCENIKVRRRECGRAYIKDDCTNCKAAFSSLKPKLSKIIDGEDTNLEWDSFPEKWAGQVTTLVLREGCNASLRFSKFNEGDNNPTPAFGFTKDKVTQNISASGSLTHYICQCPGENVSGTDTASGDTMQNYPPLVTVPRTKGAINLLLGSRQDFKNHPGLITALQSIRSRKSSKNAYILLLGMSGSGKSSAVNLLFDHPNITKVGDYVSATKDILQFSIPVPIPSLGLNNTCLHVIDTPGIGDTSGLTEDARFLASLSSLLDTHPDLRRSLPNVILIFSKFSDNRFSGEGSSFVKMLRTINIFQDRLIDKRYTNVIFVLTHFLSETKEITRDPSKRIAAIRSVIQEYTPLPRPIHIILAENKPEEAHLPNINGFYLLPNREFYPKNLFDQMQRNLINSQDPIGEAVIRTAFSNSDNFKIERKSYPLFPSTDEKVIKYLGILGALNKAVNTTEVSTALQQAYQQVDPQLKLKYPHELRILQRNLYSKNIWMKEDIPQTSVDILKFLEQIQLNPVTLFLLESAFNLTIPQFPSRFIVGSGYSILNDIVLPSQIFNLKGQSPADSSNDFIFKVPEFFKIEVDHNIDNQFQVSTSKDDFINKRMKSLGLSETSILIKDEYKASVDQFPGFNLITLSDEKSNQSWSWTSLTATVNYHSFQISLSDNVKLSNELSDYLNILKPLNISDNINVKTWQVFFEKYGTHVVTSAFGGGTIKITADCRKTPLKNGERFTILSETLANVTEQLGNELIGKDGVYNVPDDELGISYSFSQNGGDPKHYWSNFSEVDEVKNVESWRTSLKYEPVVLTNRLQIQPISRIVKEFGNDEEKLRGELIEEAAFNLLNASLVFIPVEGVQDNNPNSREMTIKEQSDYQKMHEFSLMFRTISEQNQEAQANLIKIMSESKKKRQLEEERWQERVRLMEEQRKIQDKNSIEQQRHDEQIQLKREQLEMERLQQDRLLAEEKEQAFRQSELEQMRMMEEIRANNEMNLWKFINEENARRDEMVMRNQKKWYHRVGDFLGGGLIGLALGG